MGVCMHGHTQVCMGIHSAHRHAQVCGHAPTLSSVSSQQHLACSRKRYILTAIPVLVAR